jgi:STE24 endopeptidase
MLEELMPTLILLIILVLESAFETFVDLLNLRSLDPVLPAEFKGFYDETRYAKSQDYLRVRTRFGTWQRILFTLGLVIFILAGGFNQIDLMARSVGEGPIVTGLLFIGALSILGWLVSLPFAVYSTFVIEEKFGFNLTKPKTFILDQLKGLVLGAIVGGLLGALVLWLFEALGGTAWLWAWVAVTVFQIVMMFLAPVIILPLFNKYTPLAEGELKSTIEEFARKQNFNLQGIFTMDGSKRSTKANAFFTGFGRFRRIVLFDTLIAQQTVQELTAVLAHEIGHFKRGHILRQLALSVVVSGLTFYLMSLFLLNPFLFEAFRMEQVSIYGSLVFFSMFYSPISRLLSLYGLHLSRKYEFEADRYAAETYRQPEALVTALKKLSVESLSNLRPHPLKVFVDYTHPPVLDRIKTLRTFVEN